MSESSGANVPTILVCTNTNGWSRELVESSLCVTDNTGTVRVFVQRTNDDEGDMHLAECVLAKLNGTMDAEISRLTSEVATLQSYKALHQSLTADNAALRADLARVEGERDAAHKEVIRLRHGLNQIAWPGAFGINFEQSTSEMFRHIAQDTLAIGTPVCNERVASRQPLPPEEIEAQASAHHQAIIDLAYAKAEAAELRAELDMERNANAKVELALYDAKAEVERVRGRIENLLNSLEAVRLNDRSQPYEYGEKRRLDEATPGVGQRWSTPFEISRDAIRAHAESVFGKPGVQSKKQLDALAPTPPAQQQEGSTP